tara:strand:+ start:666 stop:845 length:180 start_codon:yes stop_codon:yes gene_type:complete
MPIETTQEYIIRVELIHDILNNNNLNNKTEDYIVNKNRLAKMRLSQLHRIRRLQLLKEV